MNKAEGLDLVEEFYCDENQESDTEQVQHVVTTKSKAKPKPNHWWVCAGYSEGVAGECEGCELICVEYVKNIHINFNRV